MVAASPITKRDRALMDALGDPAAPIDPFEYAEWVKRPEIREALAARREIRAEREDAKAARFRADLMDDTRFALDTLKATVRANGNLEDPAQRAESRRAASHIVRLAAAFSRAASAPRAHPQAHRPPPFSIARSRPRVRPSPDLAPERVVALAAAALARPTEESLADLAPFLAPEQNAGPPDPDNLAHVHALYESPAAAVTYAVVSRAEDHAVYALTLKRTDRPDTALIARLARSPDGPRRNCWVIYVLDTAADAAPASPTGPDTS
jgi:hypothetical protein